MRTIKFRGRKNNGEWIYGDLARHTDVIVETISYCIYPMQAYDTYDNYVVEGETVGQFTGLYDKDGKEIYEGDILQLKYSDGSYHSSSVYYAQQKGYWAVDVSINERIILGYIDRTRLVVIGNIHDNPELLKGGNK